MSHPPVAALPALESSPVASPSVGVATLYREMWRHAAGARGRLLLAFGLLVASQLVKLAVPWLAAQAIDCLQHGTGAGTGVGAAWPWLAAILGVFVASWAMHGPARVVERSVAVRVRQAITDRLYERLADTPLAWHDRHHPGEIQHRMAQSSGALFDFTQTQFIYLQSAVNLLGPLVALTWLSTLAGGIALLGIVAIALVLLAFDRSLMRLADAENAAHRRYGAALLDCLSNMSTVLSLGLAGSTGRTLRRRLDAANQPLGRSIVLNEWKWCAVDLLTVTLAWLLVGAYAWQSNAAGALILGSLFMVYQYAQQAGSVVGAMAANLQGFSRMRTDFAGADAIWSAPRRTPDVEAAPAAAPDADDDWQRIAVCDLAYEHAARSASNGAGETRGGLRHVSLALHRGERIALVGPSGSGKSTLLRVLAGLYEPSHGHVEVDGIAHLGMRPLARRATLIPQEAQVFEGSVRDNIAFDLPYAESTIDAAARISSFDAVLEFLPGGFQAAVAQGGFNLSGGQRQRLCLARGVLAARDRALLLVAEPTPARDPLTESAVFRRIDGAFPSACIVASVHRMNLLGHFDRVVLMNAGGVVDSGSVAELLERQPMFREMVGEADAAAPSGSAHAREISAAA